MADRQAPAKVELRVFITEEQYAKVKRGQVRMSQVTGEDVTLSYIARRMIDAAPEFDPKESL